jgi:hypothetical protein
LAVEIASQGSIHASATPDFAGLQGPGTVMGRLCIGRIPHIPGESRNHQIVAEWA